MYKRQDKADEMCYRVHLYDANQKQGQGVTQSSLTNLYVQRLLP